LPTTFEANRPVIVETLSGAMLGRYCNVGLDFYAQGEIDTGIIRHRLGGAFRRLGDVSGAAAAVGAVLAVLHVLKPAGPNYDVSYSDPVLPFSIFVGVDASSGAHYDLRLAESILHECMHLQLSLIEETVPMIAGCEERFHSPWQRTMRPSQGVLHGLYVFRVIQDFHRALLEGGFCTDEEHSYLTCRISVIEEEIATIDHFRASRELTNAGKQLVGALLTS
jgi:HEXXH motif-containing protein